MQASKAPTETRLPRQIIAQSEAIKARFAARQSEGTDPAEVQTAPVEPTVDAANPVESQPPVAAPAAVATDPRVNDPKYWEHRFKVIEGVLKRERVDHNEALDTLNQQMTKLREEMRSLRETAPPPKTDLSKFFTPEQIEELGEDQCNAIIGATHREVREQVQAAIKAEVEPLREQQARDAEKAAKDARTQFTDTLAELVPDWEEVNVDPEWLAWLAQADESSGIKRQAILDTHAGRSDATEVARVFKAFKSLKQPAVPTPPVAPRGSGAGMGSNPPPPAPALARPSKDEIRDYYKRSALGKVTDAQRAAFEARLKLPAR